MIKILLIIFFVCLSSPAVRAETLKNISDFKNQLSPSQRTSLSLYNGLVYVGEFTAYLSSNELESVDKTSFLKLMSTFLTAEKYNEFKILFESKTLISKNNLSSFGFDLILDPANFKLDLRTSELFLNPNHISLNDLTANQNEINVTSSLVSGFINYSFTKSFKRDDSSGSEQALSGSLDPNLNIASVNMESHLNLDPKDGWTRTSSLVSRDFEESQIRVSLGDLSYSPKTFQSSFQYLGFRLSKEFEMSPFQIVVSRGEREIYLDTPSTVEIFINGFLIQTLSLEAGKHVLEDIPVIQGINHIILRISDNTGKKRYITFQHTGSETMLKRGIHDYDYNFGTLSSSDNSGINYTSQKVVSFAHRYGVTNFWTSGINGEYKKNFINAGPENQFATNRGLFVHNLSLSSANNENRGVASRLSYFWTCPCGLNEQIKRFSMAYEYQSPHYLNNLFTETYNLRDQRNTLFLSYNQMLTSDIAGLISASFFTYDFQKINKHQLTIGLNKNFRNDLFLTTNYQHSYTVDGQKKNNDSVLLQLSYNFDSGKKNIISTYNKSGVNQTAQAELTYNRNKPVDNIIYKARIGESNSKELASISGYYNHQKFEFLSSFDYLKENNFKTLSLNPSGSLAFAGKNFSLGQRIQQSFIVVDNQQKESLIVNGDEDNHEAYLYTGKMATLTTVQPYVSKNVNIISDDNNSLGLSNKGYRILTGRKRGSLLTIGNVLLKMAEGVLVNDKDIPYSFVGGKVINLSSGVETSFFTGKNGKFFLENLKADNYQIMIFDKNKVRVYNLDLKDRLKDERNDLGRIVVY